MNIHPNRFAEIRREAENLRKMMGDDFDPEFFTDTLDGETDVMDIIGGVLKAITETEGMEAANKSMADFYAKRAKALKDRQTAMRGVLMRIMDAMGEKTVRHAFATLSVRAGKDGPVVTDETALPAELLKVKYSPDLTKIRELDYRGDGVSWNNAGPSLTIRRA